MYSHDKTFLYGFFIVVHLFLSQTGIAQPACRCGEYDKLQTEYENSEAGSRSFIDRLKASASLICQAKAWEWMAADHLSTGNYDSSDICFQKAEKLYRQTSCGDTVLLTTYKQWAQLYYTKSDFAKAQEYTFRLLRSAEASGNPHETGVCYTMIAQLFNQTGQADKGIVYSRRAVPLIAKIGQPAKAADLLYKLAKRYLWHYQDTKTVSSLDSSEMFSYQLLTIARETGRRSSIAAAFSNLQGVAYERGELQKALQFLDSSFVYTDSDQYDHFGTNYYDRADILLALRQYDKAARMADSSLYYRRLSGHVAYIAEAYGLLSAIGKESGDYKKAYDFKAMERNILDSVRNVEKTKTVAELEKKYNQAKNEKTISELAQQKKIYLLLAVAGLLAVVAIAFFLRQQSLKHKHRILETEQRLNRSRMNPHFVFNTLASLQSLVLREKDTTAIAAAMAKFSRIMRETLESTYKEYVSLEQEIDFLEEYLALQQLRFPGKFTYVISVDDELEADDILIPSMIIQPFAENSIEHGFAGIGYPGQLTIAFKKIQKELLIEVADNGKGLTGGEKENPEHTSRASQIIKDRIYLLNVKQGTKARFSINSDAGGVIVRIFLPVLYRQDIKT